MSAIPEPEPAGVSSFHAGAAVAVFPLNQDVANGSSLARPEQAKVHDPVVGEVVGSKEWFFLGHSTFPCGVERNNAKSMVSLSEFALQNILGVGVI